MNKYRRGKIYKLTSPTTDDVYIGSTIQTLAQRLRGHKKDLDCKSREIIDNNKIINITLIEKFPCNSKTELDKREGQYHRSMPCINKQIAGRTRAEYKEDNKDKIKEQRKQYREKNKDAIAEYNAQYYEKNKASILANQAEKITCECGSVIRINDLAKHKRTKRHCEFIKNNK